VPGSPHKRRRRAPDITVREARQPKCAQIERRLAAEDQLGQKLADDRAEREPLPAESGRDVVASSACGDLSPECIDHILSPKYPRTKTTMTTAPTIQMMLFMRVSLVPTVRRL
jgi:hypothetical protein